MSEIETMKVANSCLGYEIYKGDFTVTPCENKDSCKSCQHLKNDKCERYLFDKITCKQNI